MKCKLCAAVSTCYFSKPSTWSEQNREWLYTVYSTPFHLTHLYAEHVKYLFMQNRDSFPQVSKNSLPTVRWLLRCLSNHLGCFLGFVCKHRKYETLLYPKNGDILKVLVLLEEHTKQRTSLRRIQHFCTYS